MRQKPRKPRNLKAATVDHDGSIGCSDPYVSWWAPRLPSRVTLDGEFGIQDLEWIITQMKKEKTNEERMRLQMLLDMAKIQGYSEHKLKRLEEMMTRPISFEEGLAEFRRLEDNLERPRR